MPTATISPDKVIEVAAREVGYHEGRSNGHWNNIQKYAGQVPGLEWANGQAWCATFVSWCALKAGMGDLYPRTASCDVGGKWFKDRGQWSEYPAIGAQVFFGNPSDLSHTGIVVDYNNTTIFTIEGNTNGDGSREGDGVYRKVRPRLRSNIIGYGYPAFIEGIVSADPAWANRAPSVTPPRVPAKPRRVNADTALRAARAGKAKAKTENRRDQWDQVIRLVRRLGGQS